jgi:hypothetical protein
VKRLIILALMLALCTCAWAETSKFNPPDPRLDKKVTLDVDHVKLEEVAKTLSEQTGVTIKAGSGERDWKVRERRVSVHAKDVAAMTLIDETTKLLGFYLSREGKEKEWTYIIWQDKKARDLEKEMLTAEKEAGAKRIKDSRQSALDNAQKALKMTPEEAMKLKDKDPLTAFLGGTKTGRAFSTLFSAFGSQFPTEYDLMMRGKRAFIPISAMPANMQGAMGDAVSGGFGKAFRQELGKQGEGLTPNQLMFMPLDGGNDQMAGLMGLGGMAFITGLAPGDNTRGMNNMFGGMPMATLPMMSPGSGAANLFGEAMLSIEGGESLKSIGERLGPKMQDPAFMSQLLAHDSPTEKDIPTDPELTREIEIKADALAGGSAAAMAMGGMRAVDQSKTLAEISRATGWPVLFESFARTMPIAMFVKPGKQPVYKVLIALEKGSFKWERGDGMLRIRPEDWATKRSYEIPESYMAYYKALLEKQGEFSLDDVAGIASSLSDDQLQNTFIFDPDFSFLMGSLMGGFMSGPRETLRLYASLNNDQKQALSAEGGLPFNQLTDAQWDKLNEIITDKLGGIYVADGSIRIKPLTEVETKANAPQRTFETTVQVQNEKEPRKITEVIGLPSKTELAVRKERQKKAEEAAKAAQPNKPGQTPAPAQKPQQAPAK